MNYSSKLIENAVEAFASLPGIGRKTALRLVLHLLKQDSQTTRQFAAALTTLREDIRECRSCHNLSDHEMCSICTDPRRDRALVCVVETIRDLLAIEDTGQYKGLYHVLGGIISPIEGVGPGDLNMESLLQRIETGEIKEVIMAISPTIEGETTSYYLSRKLRESSVQISAIARGVSFGGELEYADELTLARSILARVPYTQQ
ncbi:MAG: recombination mediator RecR [Saprospiraceae bacterium]